MATTDVPGANARNGDVLNTDCWAESAKQDGSYVKVESVENGRVIYSIFDTDRPDPQWFHDAMSEDAFKRQFSWDPKNPKSTQWTWHDKHKDDFPWDAVIKDGLRPGSRPAMAADTLREAGAMIQTLRARVAGGDDTVETDALRVANELGLEASDLPLSDRRMNRAAQEIMRGIQRAMRQLSR